MIAAPPFVEDTLFDAVDLVQTRLGKAVPIADRFLEFHRLNSWVLTALERLVADWLAAGETRAGIGMFYEVLRWTHKRERGVVLKLDNDFRSHYARLIVERHPDWAPAFELRELRSGVPVPAPRVYSEHEEWCVGGERRSPYDGMSGRCLCTDARCCVTDDYRGCICPACDGMCSLTHAVSSAAVS